MRTNDRQFFAEVSSQLVNTKAAFDLEEAPCCAQRRPMGRAVCDRVWEGGYRALAQVQTRGRGHR